jgi:hypothetical protein
MNQKDINEAQKKNAYCADNAKNIAKRRYECHYPITFRRWNQCEKRLQVAVSKFLL